MAAIKQMLNKLNELLKASNNPENRSIYTKLIAVFSPTSGKGLTIEQIASGIALIAQYRDNIQESAAVSFFYKKTSRKAVLDGFINAIMNEYVQDPKFVTVMKGKISELKEPTQQVIQNYSASLAAEVHTAKSELSDAQAKKTRLENTVFRTFYAQGLNDDQIDAKCKEAGQLVLEKQAQFKMAVKRQEFPGKHQEIFLKTSNYLSKMLEAARQEVACENSTGGVELIEKAYRVT